MAADDLTENSFVQYAKLKTDIQPADRFVEALVRIRDRLEAETKTMVESEADGALEKAEEFLAFVEMLAVGDNLCERLAARLLENPAIRDAAYKLIGGQGGGKPPAGSN